MNFRAWFRGLRWWERQPPPASPADEEAAFQERLRAGEARQRRLEEALDDLPDRSPPEGEAP
jgi:hypothetical protein